VTIGILAVQGAFLEHAKMLSKLGVDSFEIRKKADIQRPMDGLILPGGESTSMYRILRDLDLVDDIKRLIASGLPVFGTCAGLLLLAKEVDNYKSDFLQTMDIKAVKNAYGRQLGSFRANGSFNGEDNIELVFIRAPYIASVKDGVEVLSVHDDKIVAARQDNQLVTAFHPELSDSTFIHSYFIDMCQEALS